MFLPDVIECCETDIDICEFSKSRQLHILYEIYNTINTSYLRSYDCSNFNDRCNSSHVNKQH